ncbi:hypothetical protein WG68_13040 [Arsukibacterium ikkense]|uniref:Uncharacterized protein n=1 Tax=Arsukibacterium ikkense TaxID=336831 RepID=A0A0M2V5X7_9GAMM|nr:hypothetical protein WG68_13040 [Arsukibacterium ikkense]
MAKSFPNIIQIPFKLKLLCSPGQASYLLSLLFTACRLSGYWQDMVPTGITFKPGGLWQHR